MSAENKAVEHWGLASAMTMMQQLGMIPEN
jgi:hypothetical protein